MPGPHAQTPDRLDRIAVVIVNYGTATLAAAAVRSVLARDHGGRTVETHLVDNASPGDDAAQLAEIHAEEGWGDRVTLYPETVNHGFGRGNNVVIEALLAREVPPDALFLLNSDAAVEDGAIDGLARALEADPRAGFAGPQITDPDGTPVTAAFRFPSLRREFAGALSFGPVTRLGPAWDMILPPDHPEGPVGWVAGAGLMIRARTLREVGAFDPDYFLYHEEVDLMRRGARAGWATLYVPGARILHLEGASTGVASGQGGRPRRPAYVYQSWALYWRKNHGAAAALAACLLRLSGAAGNHLLSRLRSRPPAAPAHFFGDFWRHGLRTVLAGRAAP
jgi:GT2 family glycosyltransferase